MRVAMYYRNSDVRLQEMPRPEPGPGEILVRVLASGICGSDVMEWYRIRKAPLILGHEIAGDIEEVGEGVDKWNVGDRVVVTHHVPCDDCDYCRSGHQSVCDTLRTTNFYPGGFSEFVRIPELNVNKGTLRLPEGVSYEEGTFVEPLGCVVRGMRLAGIESGKSVLILGAGVAGSLNLKMARHLGAGKIIVTDISPQRLEFARRFGANYQLDAGENVPEFVREVTKSDGADLVVICTGALSAFEQGINSVNRGGAILFFACPKPDERVLLDVNRLWKNEVRLMTSYAASPDDLRSAMKLISDREIIVDDMITHRLPLAETQKGFEIMATGSEGSMKVIIEPQR